MLSSSASISIGSGQKHVSIIALAIAILSLAGCASSPPSIAPSEFQAELVGAVTISGEHPYERQLILADTSGVYWLVESPEYEGELLELGGQSIRALGLASTDASGYRNLLIRWYDLHPAPGRISGVGILERWGDDLVLFAQREGRHEEGQRVLIIDGPLRSVLELHIGYRIWIRGESVGAPGGGEGDAFELATELDERDDDETAPGDATPESVQQDGSGDRSALISLIRIVVMEYGVLGPPIPSQEASPRSTLPDSNMR